MADVVVLQDRLYCTRKERFIPCKMIMKCFVFFISEEGAMNVIQSGA